MAYITKDNRNTQDNKENKNNIYIYPTNFGSNNYFKAAIYLILASNTPPTPPHAGGRGGGGGRGGMGWEGGVFEARIK